MKTKIIITALAVAVASVGLAPQNAIADNPYKKTIKKIRKQEKKRYKKMRKHYRKHHDRDHHDWRDHDDWDDHDWGRRWGHYPRHYYRPYKIEYDYDYPDYDSEDWGIYTTPSGGLGFYYSEREGPRYNPYGYGIGFRFD